MFLMSFSALKVVDNKDISVCSYGDQTIFHIDPSSYTLYIGCILKTNCKEYLRLKYLTQTEEKSRMFFDPREAGMQPVPFTHTVYNSLVVPRPIGWISTISVSGVINLAPYSFFNSVSGDPPCVMFCPNGFKPGTRDPKDSLVNAETTGEFVFNMCTYDLRNEMNATSEHVPASINEMEKAGLEAMGCFNVKPPRVKASPMVLECQYLQTVRLPSTKSGSPNRIVIGEVIGIHVDEEMIVDGVIDIRRVKPLARLGYLDYASIESENIFPINRPD